MAQNFSKGLKQTAVQGVTTTTANSTIYGDRVDMANYDGCMFSFVFKSTATSTGTAGLSIVGSNSSTAAAATYTAISGASLTVTKSSNANSKRLASIDVYRPQYRYLRPLVVKKDRLILESVIAQQYGPRQEPAGASTTLAAATAAACKVFVAMQSTST